ncbi:2'-5' RNA ligase family protein [Microbacterium deminutum]|uniref:2'-5' RNA ligase family protein n=1 Tax=Microbacterium deminutum TaxID=344164 RepID=A0ABN2R3C1_9MICO
MPDLVSIELVLDPDTESRVRADWHRLADAGLPSLASRRAASNRPHLTLMVRPVLNEMGFADAVAQLPVVITLAEPIVFRHGDSGVLARRVVPSQDLLRLHRVVHAALPPGEDAAHTTPGHWTPHVTLARRLRLDVLPEALLLLGPAHTGTGIALRRWDSAVARVTPIY